MQVRCPGQDGHKAFGLGITRPCVKEYGGDYSTERNDGLNHGTERFLKLKLATYHC